MFCYTIFICHILHNYLHSSYMLLSFLHLNKMPLIHIMTEWQLSYRHEKRCAAGCFQNNRFESARVTAVTAVMSVMALISSLPRCLPSTLIVKMTKCL